MQHFRIPTAILCVTTMLLAACGGKDSSGLQTLNSGEKPAVLRAGSAGFELVLNPDSMSTGGSLEAVSLDLSEQDDGSLLASVGVESAQGLRALYFSIEYDTETWHAVESVALPDFSGDQEIISLAVLDTAAAMHHGQLLVHPQSAEGYSGSGKLATVRFAPGPLEQARTASKAPTGPGSRSDISHAHNTTFGLFWHYYNQGDYDQNGEVNISDLTPLGINLKQVGPFGPATILGLVDGDANGEINLADITPIGANFGASVSSYNLYASNDFAAYPADGGPSTIDPYATKEFSDYQLPDADHHAGPLPKEGRLFYWGEFISQMLGDENYNYYWVRPTDGTTEGMPSYVLASPLYFEGSPDILEPPTLTVEGAQESGNVLDPIVAGPGAEYKITVLDPVLGDISTHPDMRYRYVTENGTPWPHASISNSDAMLRISPDAPDVDGVLHLQYFFGVLNYRQGILGGTRGQGGPFGVYFTDSPLVDPTADTGITPLEGMAPLTISFDGSGSSSPNGDIRWYTWDFDKYGPTFGSSTDISGEYTYTDPGVYVVELMVADEWNKQDTTQVIVTALAGADEPPVASIIPDEIFGYAPITVNYSAEFSRATEGRSITKYEWDIDGDTDNGFELDTGSVPFAQITHDVGKGFFAPRVQVTDDQGDSTIAETTMVVYSPLNHRPVIDLVIDVTEGSSPLLVNFDASGTTDDGTLEKWGWDFDGDGDLELFDTSDPPAGPIASYTYATSGAFHGYLYVWDDDDEMSFWEFVIRTDGAPTAAIEYPGGPFFDVPLELELDASASTDPDSSIVEYRWDFDGDMVVDEVTTEPTVLHEFASSGSQLVIVTVVDDNGLTDWAYTSFTIF